MITNFNGVFNSLLNLMVSERFLRLKIPAGLEGQSGETYCKSPGENSADEEGRREEREREVNSQTRALSVSLGLFSG